MFVNGELIESEDRAGAVNVTNSALILGARDNSGNYNSGSRNIGNYASVWLDDVRFYNVFLSNADIAQIYGGGMGMLDSPGFELPVQLQQLLQLGWRFIPGYRN